MAELTPGPAAANSQTGLHLGNYIGVATMRKQYTPIPSAKMTVNRDAVIASLRAVQVDLELLAAWLEAEHEPVMAERSLEILDWFHTTLLTYEPSVTRH